MKTVGIVAEFNPYHNGHQALTDFAREKGGTHIVAVMSGNFVQRGDAAITEKRVRTKMALLNGIDLVIELPLAYATATAQHFARGAIAIMSATNCIDTLCFGSELGDESLLLQTANAIDDKIIIPALSSYLAQGLTFAKARQNAICEIFGEDIAKNLSTPNNTLAIEYLRAAKNQNWQPEILTLKRKGMHDSQIICEEFASASYLRKLIKPEHIYKYIPNHSKTLIEESIASGMYPANFSKLHLAILAKLRTMSLDEISKLPDLSEGLDNRLYNCIKISTTIDNLYSNLKTKRYTQARIRRLVLHAFLGITAEDTAENPPYIRVLGFNTKGKEILARMSQSSLPVDTKLSRLKNHNEQAERCAFLEAQSTDIYTLSLPIAQKCGYEYSASGIFIK